MFKSLLLLSGSTVALSGAQTLLATLGDSYGMAIDFATDQSIDIQDAGTPANNYVSSGTVSAGALVGPGGKLTYASPSPKLCLQSTGYYAYGAHNLLTYSEQVDNAAWTQTRVTVTANATTAPDGTSTADAILEDGTLDNRHVRQPVSTLTGTYYLSACVKAGTRSYAGLFWGTGGSKYAHFNLGSGTVAGSSGVVSSSITALSGGWYRVSMVVDAAGDNHAGIAPATSSASNLFEYQGVNGATALYAWGAQISVYPCVTDYIATTSAAIYSLPYEWNTSAVCQGLLVEEARTNLLFYSTTFSDASWTKDSCAVTSAQTTGPDGTSSGWKMLVNAGTNSNNLYGTNFTGTAVANTYSVIAKYGNTQWLWLRGISGTQWAAFDLQNGVVGNNLGGISSSSMTSLGNGWYKCSCTYTCIASAGLVVIVQLGTGSTPSGAGVVQAGTEYCYLYQCQNEAAATASSPIRTGSASVTRAADDINLSAASFPTSNVTGTAYAKFTTANVASGDKGVVTITDANGEAIFVNTATIKTFDGTNTVSSGITATANTVAKAATSWTTSGSVLAQSANGNNAVSGTFDGTMGASTTLRLGETAAATNSLNGYLQAVLILPRAATTAEIKTLST